MKPETKQLLTQSVKDVRLPRYQELPNVGLYLEQTTKYISEFLSPLGEAPLTASMISNYVKRGLVSSPVKKQYDRSQIAHLIFIALAKNVLSLDALQQFIHLQERTYTINKAYDYFCMEFENVLQYIFGLKDSLEDVGTDSTDEKTLLRNIIITICHKIYLEQFLTSLISEESQEG